MSFGLGAFCPTDFGPPDLLPEGAVYDSRRKPKYARLVFPVMPGVLSIMLEVRFLIFPISRLCLSPLEIILDCISLGTALSV